MIDTLITSKTRIKLLIKFFLNPDTLAHLRGLEAEFGESSNAIRLELNRLEQAGMLHSLPNGNKKLFKVNSAHPMFADIHNIIKKFIGIDVIVDNVAKRLGDLECVYLTGNLAKGIDDKIIDLVFVGNIDKGYLLHLIEKAEKLMQRKVRFLVYNSDEKPDFDAHSGSYLLLWNR